MLLYHWYMSTKNLGCLGEEKGQIKWILKWKTGDKSDIATIKVLFDVTIKT